MSEELNRLNPEVIKWLQNMREEDIKDIAEIVKFSNQVQTGASIIKWCALAIIATLVALSQVSDSVNTITTFFKAHIK